MRWEEELGEGFSQSTRPALQRLYPRFILWQDLSFALTQTIAQLVETGHVRGPMNLKDEILPEKAFQLKLIAQAKGEFEIDVRRGC